LSFLNWDLVFPKSGFWVAEGFFCLKIIAEIRHVFCSEAVARFSVNSLIGILSPAERERGGQKEFWDRIGTSGCLGVA